MFQDLVQVVQLINRLVPAPLNLHAILYLGSKDWSFLERSESYIGYETKDNLGNPVYLRIYCRRHVLPDTIIYDFFGIEFRFTYLNRKFEAEYPVSEGVSKGDIADEVLKDIVGKIGGEGCVVAGIQGVCKQIGNAYLVIRPL